MKILYADNHIAVCIKPVGMDAELEVPQNIIKELGGECFTVHRLDKNVGGVMVYARNNAAAAELSRAIQEKTMVKEYLALVHGTPPESGDWSNLLWKDSAKNKVFVVKRERKGVKAARLEFDRLTAGSQSLVHIRLHTGRSHQIRVQFSSRGYPLVGDHKYGARDESPAPQLYSYRISFPFRGRLHSYQATPSWASIQNA